MHVIPLTDHDRPWAEQVLIEHWASPRVVTRGRIHDAAMLPGLMVFVEDVPVGLLTYIIEGGDLEIVTLNSLRERQGVGTALLAEVIAIARRANCRRVWLITTNDNLQAIGFYQRRSFVLAALYPGAIAQSRRLKPEIPAMGREGIPLRDEIELEFSLRG